MSIKQTERTTRLHNDDIVLALLVLGANKRRTFTTNSVSLHNALYTTLSGVGSFAILENAPHIYSQDLATSLSHLRVSRLIESTSPDYDVFIVSDDAGRVFDKIVRPRLGKETIDNLFRLSMELWSNRDFYVQEQSVAE